MPKQRLPNPLAIDLEPRGGVTRRVFHDAPIDVAVSPDDAFAFVTNLDSVVVFDTAANVVKSTSVGALPRATRLSADGKRAYVLDFDQHTIWALDTTDNSYVIDSVYLSHALSLADDLRLSTRFSMRSAPRVTPPVAAKPAATRRAPSVMLIA
jgi:hypothetical protein